MMFDDIRRLAIALPAVEESAHFRIPGTDRPNGRPAGQDGAPADATSTPDRGFGAGAMAA
jgi:hypothetical protein